MPQPNSFSHVYEIGFGLISIGFTVSPKSCVNLCGMELFAIISESLPLNSTLVIAPEGNTETRYWLEERAQ